MTKLFSYVVEHDYGSAPNPFNGYCTLATCKLGFKRRNIVEMAQEGNWIVGTGGLSGESIGRHGTLIYAMRVDEILPLAQYCSGKSSNRIDSQDAIRLRLDQQDGRRALKSNHFFYFGKEAIEIPRRFKKHRLHPLEKTGPGYRCDFSEKFAKDFVEWLENNYEVGVHGLPCKPRPERRLPKCPAQVQRKGCTR